MTDEWQNSKANNGVCGADAYAEPNPDLTAIRNDYRWTPAVPAGVSGGAGLWRQCHARGEGGQQVAALGL